MQSFRSRFKSHKQQLRLVIFSCLSAWQTTAIAEVVYSLNNYASSQDGGTLTGSITVSDIAADDGVLVEGEILAWQFLAVGSRSNISGSSLATLRSAVEALNISIDADFITVNDSIDGRNRWLSLVAFSGDDGTLT